ncbi:MAG: hypothetical protein JWR61_2227 [Ferruginibacter sp.]|uniref:hypothetical protein n=1 Tax=Ferruginibacter sp. TaxID=1940288 RepID=UPI002659F05F|nr:hypothetical protein [Ferruginibacter sp.]MDB5277272.1 hypothetical protein [Ferruginibacter sp.]
MNHFLRRWLSVSFFNLLLVATLGVILRYKIAFYLPFVQQKFLLHSHSHFAFSGWITQTLMVLLVHYLAVKNGEAMLKRYRWLLYANCITAYGMLISFIFQGYAFFSITFSTLSIFVSYFFAVYYFKDLAKLKEKSICHYWFRAALIFSVLSSLGAFSLAYMMATKMMVQNLYLAAIYFFLHFQYNGWFFFAGMGLLFTKLEQVPAIAGQLKKVFWLFCLACPPAYFLSALWLPFPFVVYCIIVIAVAAQLIGWGIMIKVLLQQKAFIQTHFSKHGRTLLLLSAIAFSIKLVLQTGSVHPALSQLSYGFRPIIIGYLHLVLLGVTSIFIIGYIISFELIPFTKKIFTGIFIFVAGIIINEILLMVQGVAALGYTTVDGINIMLLMAALVLCTGVAILFSGLIKKDASLRL